MSRVWKLSFSNAYFSYGFPTNPGLISYTECGISKVNNEWYSNVPFTLEYPSIKPSVNIPILFSFGFDIYKIKHPKQMRVLEQKQIVRKLCNLINTLIGKHRKNRCNCDVLTATNIIVKFLTYIFSFTHHSMEIFAADRHSHLSALYNPWRGCLYKYGKSMWKSVLVNRDFVNMTSGCWKPSFHLMKSQVWK